MPDYHDEFGNSRTHTGQFNNHWGASSAEQWLAGVGHHDSHLSAQAKVEMHRRAMGLDPLTGLPLSSNSGGYYGGGHSGGLRLGALFSKLFWVALLLALALAARIGGPVLWKDTGGQRSALALKIEMWGLEKALEGEQYAPFAAYEKYAPKKNPAADASPSDLNRKAMGLLKANAKGPSDKALAMWGSASWRCMSETPLCLQSAGIQQSNSLNDMRMLGLQFLGLAQEKGSPDAAADIGLYMISEGSPFGKAPGWAKVKWEEAVQENPEAVRPRRLLEKAKESFWASATARLAKFIRD